MLSVPIRCFDRAIAADRSRFTCSCEAQNWNRLPSYCFDRNEHNSTTLLRKLLSHENLETRVSVRFLSRLAGFIFKTATALEVDHFLRKDRESATILESKGKKRTYFDHLDQLTSVLIDHFGGTRLIVSLIALLLFIASLARPEERTTRRQRTTRTECTTHSQASTGTHEPVLSTDGQTGARLVGQEQNDGQHSRQSYELGCGRHCGHRLLEQRVCSTSTRIAKRDRAQDDGSVL